MADGSIVIDVDFNTRGVDAGSNELLKAIKGVTEAANKLAETMQSGFVSAFQTANNLNLNGVTGSIESTAERTQGAIENMARGVSESVSGMQQTYTSAASSIRTTPLDTKANQMQTAVGRVTNEITRLQSSASRGFTTATQAMNFSDRVDRAARSVELCRERLEAFGNTTVKTEQYAQIEKEYAKAEQALAKLYAKQESLTSAAARANAEVEALRERFSDLRNHDEFQSISEQLAAAEAQATKLNKKLADSRIPLAESIKQAEMEADRLESKLIALRQSGQSTITGRDTEGYARMNEELMRSENFISETLNGIQQEQIEQARLNYLAAQEAVARAQTPEEIKRAKSVLKEMKAEYLGLINAQTRAAESKGPDTTPWQRFSAVLSRTVDNLVDFATRVGHVALSVAKFTVTKAVQGVQTFGRAFVSASKHMMPFSSLLNKAKDSASNFVKKLTSFKTMLITRIKRTFITQIMNEISDSMKALALYDSTFNDALSNIVNTIKEFSRNLMVSFGGIIKTVEPVVMRVITLMNELTRKINAFSAYLNGAKTVTVAKKVTQSYAESLEDEANNSKKAAAAQKKLNATLTSYDELHRLDDNSVNATTSVKDAEDSLADLRDVYETVSVDSVFAELPDFGAALYGRIKDSIQKKDWRTLGTILADGLNLALGKLSEFTVGIRDRAVNAALAVAEFTSAVTEGLDGNKLGRAIADTFKLAFDTVDAFNANYNWGALGQKVVDTINTIFGDSELWRSIGATIGHGFQASVDFAYPIASNLNWHSIGTAIGDSLNALGEQIDFLKLGRTIGGLFQGLVATVNGLVTELDWTAVGEALASTLNGLGDSISLEYLAETLTKTVNGALDSVIAFFRNVDWAERGREVARSIEKLFTNIDPERVAEAINAVVMAAIEFMKGLADTWETDGFGEKVFQWLWNVITNIDWISLGQYAFESLKNSIMAAVSTGGKLGTILADKIKSTITGKELEDTGENLGAGLYSGLGKEVKASDWNKTFKKVTGAAEDEYEVHSPSKVFSKIGGFLVEGLHDGIDGAWSVVTQLLTTTTSAMKTLLSGAWNAIKSTATGAWTDIKNSVTSVVDQMLDALNKADNSVNTIQKDIANKMSAISNSVDNAYNSLKSKDFSGVGRAITSSLTSGMLSGLDSLKDDFSGRINDLWEYAYRYVNFSSVGENIAEGVRDGLRERWGAIEDDIADLSKDLIEKAKEVLGIASPSKRFAEIGRYIDEGLSRGIARNEGVVNSAVDGLSNAISQRVNPEVEIKPQLNFLDATRKANQVLTNVEKSVNISLKDNVTGKLDSIMNKLSAITEKFSAIADMLANVGTLPTPRYVTGVVAPTSLYNTKTDTETKQMLQKIITLLTPKTDDSAESRRRIEIPVTLDRRQIGLAIADLDTSNGRVTNGGGRL